MAVNDNTNIGFEIERGYVYLAKGNVYLHKKSNIQYELLELLDLNQGVFKNLITLKSELMSIHDFKNMSQPDGSVMKVDANYIGDEDWEDAQRKYFSIKPLLNLDPDYAGSNGLEKRAKECEVSSRTIRRWINAYKTTGSVVSLLDKKRGWQKGKVRLNYESDSLIQKVIQEFYLTKQRPSVEATIREVFKCCHQHGIEKPSKKAVRYRIEQLSEKEVLKGRGYRERAKNKFTAKPGSFPNADYPLSVVQIDHTPVDIILVDDKYRKPIGRPWVTLAIDVYSRMITGYYISLDAPSVTSVGMCLSSSILPKNDLLINYGLDAVEWNVFGYPQKIHVDNGSDFRAMNLKRSCALHGIDIEFRPLARPEYGGHIERVIGHFMQKVHELPGTTFSNVKQRDGYDADKNASLTLAEFEQWFLTYVTKIYHQSIHSALGRSPAEQWQIGIFGENLEEGRGIPAIPSDAQTLVLDFMPYFERTVQHTGVRINGLHYYDSCLNKYINATGENNEKQKFIFRQDPRDISQIWFFDPELKQYFKIPFANQTLPSMSLWEYQQLYSKVKQSSGGVNEHLIYQAWEEMQVLVEKAEKNTKTLRRQSQRRKTHVQSQGIYETTQSSKLREKAPLPSNHAQVPPIRPSLSSDDVGFFEDIE